MNSLCGFASVNHLHFHFFYLDHELIADYCVSFCCNLNVLTITKYITSCLKRNILVVIWNVFYFFIWSFFYFFIWSFFYFFYLKFLLFLIKEEETLIENIKILFLGLPVNTHHCTHCMVLYWKKNRTKLPVTAIVPRNFMNILILNKALFFSFTTSYYIYMCCHKWIRQKSVLVFKF